MAESFASACSKILENVSLLPAESVPLLELAGRVLAEDVRAPWDMPRWDNSAMDGFAIHADDCTTPQPLVIDGYLPAGCSADGVTVRPGRAVRIMTGAPTPGGCAAVIPVEETEEVDGQLIIKTRIRPGDHIRVRGEDMREGELMAVAGTLLRPVEINLLAAFGLRAVKVYRRPKVAILSTGDELVEPGEPVGPGQIVNSNAYSLAAAVREIGGEPRLLGIAADSRASLMSRIAGAADADVLITTAGVSMGDRDLVCEVLEELGVKQLFWKIDIKPGRPTAFGLRDGQPVFSLPGNPVSSMITFEELVRPALLKMMGHQRVLRRAVKAIIQEPVAKKPGRLQFLRVRVVDDGRQLLAASSGDQNTGILRTLLRANGIAVLPADKGHIEAGEMVDIHLLSEVDVL